MIENRAIMLPSTLNNHRLVVRDRNWANVSESGYFIPNGMQNMIRNNNRRVYTELRVNTESLRQNLDNLTTQKRNKFLLLNDLRNKFTRKHAINTLGLKFANMGLSITDITKNLYSYLPR